MNEVSTIGSEHRQTLLVLGAGPKAIAIAAKRAMLATLGYNVPRVVIVDRQGIAAHWSGAFGFTDGRQLLGTRPEIVFSRHIMRIRLYSAVLIIGK